ncbi:MAG TPA: CDP-archaeol synthase [Patescibacteria group bacterium]
MNFWQNIFFAFWFFLPAGLANMFPIFAAHAPFLRHWEFPLDFNITWRGHRLLGPNKTLRGLIIGILVAIVTVAIQKEIYMHWEYLRMLGLNYQMINPVILGFLLGAGALLGDALKSFFKRWLDLPSGDSWFFFDQIDYIFGGILFSYFYQPLNLSQYLYIIVTYFVLHLLFSALGFVLGLKQQLI